MNDVKDTTQPKKDSSDIDITGLEWLIEEVYAFGQALVKERLYTYNSPHETLRKIAIRCEALSQTIYAILKKEGFEKMTIGDRILLNEPDPPYYDEYIEAIDAGYKGDYWQWEREQRDEAADKEVDRRMENE